MDSPPHVPVLLDRVVALLAPCPRPRPGAVLVDATLGLGGHTEAVLTRCELARVVGIDRDPEALELARERLAGSATGSPACTPSTTRCPTCSTTSAWHAVDAVLFDLGVSSMQLDVRERGFAYAEDAPLDMRMDGTDGPTAADVLNTYSAAELTRVLREYGEEKFARKIAAAVVRQREQAPFTTSARLVELLYAEIPAPARRTGGHPAKRTFQALRMEVNDELAVLRRAIPAAIDAIAVGGRVVVESYHSLEDRLVKQAFAAATRSDVAARTCRSCPRGSEPALRLVTRGAEQAERRRDRREPARRLGAAARRRTGQARQHGSSSMSSPAVQRPLSRVPRARRGRRRAGPAHRRPAPPGPRGPDAVRDPGQPGAARRRRRAALLQHLDAAGVVRGDRARGAGRQPHRPRADPARGAPGAARPAARGDPGRSRPGWSCRRAVHSGWLPAPPRGTARRPPPTTRRTCWPRPPPKPRVLDPDPVVVVLHPRPQPGQPGGKHHGQEPAGPTATRRAADRIRRRDGAR